MAINNVKKIRLKGSVKDFRDDYNAIDSNDILGIHRYLMFELIKKIFIGLLTGLVNEYNYTKCASLSNQKYMIQPTLINSHPNEYSQGLHYYPFGVKLDRCVGNFNTLNDLSNNVCWT